jgi:signal transduction histidine kinase
MVLFEDVTQQRLADKSRDAFVAQATHELRTPLTNVRLYIDELLETEDPTPEVRARCIDVISRETRRLERMVSDMLSLAEIEAGTHALHIDDVRLDAMLDGLERDFRAYAEEKRIKLEFKLPPKLPVVAGDRDKIEMTLANLMGNALKYTPEEGAVTLTVRLAGTDVRFEIADTGIGVREDELELVFRNFYRSKDTRVANVKGTGLGLPIARQIARLHGGDITVSSVVDHGSTFTFILPLKAPTQALAA